jgi:hypothetical protein
MLQTYTFGAPVLVGRGIGKPHPAPPAGASIKDRPPAVISHGGPASVPSDKPAKNIHQ